MGKYHKGIRIEGAEEFLLAVNITGKGAPTEDTEAEPGMCYLDEDSENGDLYKCIGMLVTETRTVYRWKKLAGQEEVERLSEAIGGHAIGGGIWYGSTSTSANTTLKVVTTETRDFKLVRGARLGVKFLTNTYVINALNVDGTGEVTIKSMNDESGTTDTASTVWHNLGQVQWFTYDGTYFIADDSVRATPANGILGKVSVSDSVNSTGDTVASSTAVKTAYDKAVDALNAVTALDTALAAVIGSGVIIV